MSNTNLDLNRLMTISLNQQDQENQFMNYGTYGNQVGQTEGERYYTTTMYGRDLDLIKIIEIQSDPSKIQQATDFLESDVEKTNQNEFNQKIMNELQAKVLEIDQQIKIITPYNKDYQLIVQYKNLIEKQISSLNFAKGLLTPIKNNREYTKEAAKMDEGQGDMYTRQNDSLQTDNKFTEQLIINDVQIVTSNESKDGYKFDGPGTFIYTMLYVITISYGFYVGIVWYLRRDRDDY